MRATTRNARLCKLRLGAVGDSLVGLARPGLARLVELGLGWLSRLGPGAGVLGAAGWAVESWAWVV